MDTPPDTKKLKDYVSLVRAPQDVQDKVRGWIDAEKSGTWIMEQLRAQLQMDSSPGAVYNYIKRYKKERRDHLQTAQAGDQLVSEIQEELNGIRKILDDIPTTSEKVEVLKGIVLKCFNRITKLEAVTHETPNPQLEGIIVRYLGEVRENIKLLHALTDQETPESQISAIVQTELLNFLEVFKDIILEVCPEHIHTIKDKLKLRLVITPPTPTPPPKDEPTESHPRLPE